VKKREKCQEPAPAGGILLNGTLIGGRAELPEVVVGPDLLDPLRGFLLRRRRLLRLDRR